MAKRIVLVVMLVAMCLGLRACGNYDAWDTVYTYDRAIVALADGSIVTGRVQNWTDMDLTRKDMCWAWVQGSFSNGEKHASKRYSVQWRPSDIIVEDGKLCLKPEHINVDLDEEELWDLSDEEEKKAKEDFKKIIPVGMYFEKVQTLANGARFIDV